MKNISDFFACNCYRNKTFPETTTMLTKLTRQFMNSDESKNLNKSLDKLEFIFFQSLKKLGETSKKAF